MVRERVARLVPSAAIGLAPRPATLVNIQTIMWLATPTQRTLAPLTILGQRVEVTLRLDHVDWAFGDGRHDSNSMPGKAYDAMGHPCRSIDCPGYYGHTYRGTGAMTVAATAAWAASFSVAGGHPVRIPATVGGPAATAQLLVREARGVLVPDPSAP
ncbi:MAG: hypothetical protein JWO57_858 [Pseudonocardiales bacterium]|nr:hypothetical protein [Pseudonocardiales bacterium]